MAKSKKKNIGLIVLILVLVPLLFAAGYVIASGGAENLLQWFGIGETTAPPNSKDPSTPGEPNGEDPSTPGKEPVDEPSDPGTNDEEPPDQ